MTFDEEMKQEQWPEEIKQAYAEIEVPSLYETLLNYEKLAYEIRRQNKELCAISKTTSEFPEIIQHLLEDSLSVFAHDNPQEANDEAHSISLTDALQNLSTQASSTLDTIAKTLPSSSFSAFLTYKNWTSLANSLLTSLKEAIQLIANKSLVNLANQGIEIIAPQVGDPFSSTLHRAIETCSNGEEGTVAKLIRLGYQKNQVVLRPADVTVYIKTGRSTDE